jgi:hypothetical protein
VLAVRHKVSTRPVRVGRDADELGCRVSRVIGYRSYCTCGWEGHVLRAVREARAEGRYHAGIPSVSGAPA